MELLESKAASRLSVTPLGQELETSASQLSKIPLLGTCEIARLALSMLTDTYVQPLSIDALNVELTGLARPGHYGHRRSAPSRP